MIMYRKINRQYDNSAILWIQKALTNFTIEGGIQMLDFTNLYLDNL